MARAFVSIGSSIAPEENLREAIRLLSQRARLAGISTIYRTAPLDRPGHPPFLNCVVELETDLPPDQLEGGLLKPIEQERGRERGPDPWGPRTCDLDLVLYLRGGETVAPRPDDLARPFVSAPLAELDPGLVLPGHRLPLRDDSHPTARDGMEPLVAMTERIRERFLNGDQHSAD